MGFVVLETATFEKVAAKFATHRKGKYKKGTNNSLLAELKGLKNWKVKKQMNSENLSSSPEESISSNDLLSLRVSCIQKAISQTDESHELKQKV